MAVLPYAGLLKLLDGQKAWLNPINIKVHSPLFWRKVRGEVNEVREPRTSASWGVRPNGWNVRFMKCDLGVEDLSQEAFIIG